MQYRPLMESREYRVPGEVQVGMVRDPARGMIYLFAAVSAGASALSGDILKVSPPQKLFPRLAGIAPLPIRGGAGRERGPTKTILNSESRVLV